MFFWPDIKLPGFGVQSEEWAPIAGKITTGLNMSIYLE